MRTYTIHPPKKYYILGKVKIQTTLTNPIELYGHRPWRITTKAPHKEHSHPLLIDASSQLLVGILPVITPAKW